MNHYYHGDGFAGSLVAMLVCTILIITLIGASKVTGYSGPSWMQSESKIADARAREAEALAIAADADARARIGEADAAAWADVNSTWSIALVVIVLALVMVGAILYTNRTAGVVRMEAMRHQRQLIESQHEQHQMLGNMQDEAAQRGYSFRVVNNHAELVDGDFVVARKMLIG